MNVQMSFFSILYIVQRTYCVSLVPSGTCSPAVRMAQTLMSACICSLTNRGDTARRHMSRRGRSTLSSMTSKITGFILHHTYVWEKNISFSGYQHEVVTESEAQKLRLSLELLFISAHPPLSQV